MNCSVLSKLFGRQSKFIISTRKFASYSAALYPLRRSSVVDRSLLLEAKFRILDDNNVSGLIMRTKRYKDVSTTGNIQDMLSLMRSCLLMEKLKSDSSTSELTFTGASVDPLTLACRIGTLLQSHNIDFAVGGSLAFGILAVPRVTVDVDMHIFSDVNNAEDRDKIVDLFQKDDTFNSFLSEHSGHVVTRDEAVSLLQKDNQLYMKMSGRNVSVFWPHTNVESAVENIRKVGVVLQKKNDQNLFLLDIETLVVYNLLWKRSQDIVDLQHIFAVYGDKLDLNYVKTMLDRRGLSETDESYELFTWLQKDFIGKYE